jgi:CheY-like chemotaxis protein
MKNKTILVIEDNRINLKLVRVLLTIGNYQVLEASDAESGIALAREHIPDLILMDMELPGMDGHCATKIIKEDELLKTIPVLALTAQSMPGDDIKAMEAGCSAYITKPIDTKNFLHTIDGHLKE